MSHQYILNVDHTTWKVWIIESDKIEVFIETTMYGPITDNAKIEFSEWLNWIVRKLFDKEGPRKVVCNVPESYMEMFGIKHLFT